MPPRPAVADKRGSCAGCERPNVVATGSVLRIIMPPKNRTAACCPVDIMPPAARHKRGGPAVIPRPPLPLAPQLNYRPTPPPAPHTYHRHSLPPTAAHPTSTPAAAAAEKLRAFRPARGWRVRVPRPRRPPTPPPSTTPPTHRVPRWRPTTPPPTRRNVPQAGMGRV